MVSDLRLLLCLCSALTFVPARVEAADGLLRIRISDTGTARRVVLDLRRLPAQIPALEQDERGTRALLANGDQVRLPVLQHHRIARQFLLKARDGRPARFVVDFVAAPAEAPPPAAVVQLASAVAATSDTPVADAVMVETSAAASAPPLEPFRLRLRHFEQSASHESDKKGSHHIGRPFLSFFDCITVSDSIKNGKGLEDKNLRLSGFVEAEGRWFVRRSDDGITRRYFGSVAAEPSLRWQAGDNHRLTITGFARAETGGTRRSHADLREAKYEGQYGAFALTIGVDRRFWGQLEAVHLVDIINQIDTPEDIDAEDKLGQPLVSLKWSGTSTSLEAFALPYFRDRRFPNRADRPNARLPVRGAALRDGTSDHWTPDFAVRATLTAGPLDLAAFFFDGLAREPRLAPTQNGSFIFAGLPDGLRAVHDRTRQVGGEALAVLGPLRLKAEGSYRWNRHDRFAAAPASGSFGFGGEYSFASVIGGADVNLLAEYYHDSRGRSAAVFNNDLFLGLRVAGNDLRSTEILAGAVLDLKRRSALLNVEASRRIAQSFTLLIDARLPLGAAPDDALNLLRDDGFVQLKLRYNF
jgi:hypothetical protein